MAAALMEGSLETPTHHPMAWQDVARYGEPALEPKLRRAFAICHVCRRCFNFCDSFPILFDAADESPAGTKYVRL